MLDDFITLRVTAVANNLAPRYPHICDVVRPRTKGQGLKWVDAKERSGRQVNSRKVSRFPDRNAGLKSEGLCPTRRGAA